MFYVLFVFYLHLVKCSFFPPSGFVLYKIPQSLEGLYDKTDLTACFWIITANVIQTGGESSKPSLPPDRLNPSQSSNNWTCVWTCADTRQSSGITAALSDRSSFGRSIRLHPSTASQLYSKSHDFITLPIMHSDKLTCSAKTTSRKKKLPSESQGECKVCLF